ncbi:hypothetical protein Hypma_003883 [Hypsizygus marmoreus]|uniref:Uncharacterized protein n=1 Tax=Hypsizygus marmoreus TaxID=39966 RepID=A0A369K245_HYPMA|nr:hypothetical protein Hypma_003883 [Hypsizygus marmoreus]
MADFHLGPLQIRLTQKRFTRVDLNAPQTQTAPPFWQAQDPGPPPNTYSLEDSLFPEFPPPLDAPDSPPTGDDIFTFSSPPLVGDPLPGPSPSDDIPPLGDPPPPPPPPPAVLPAPAPPPINRWVEPQFHLDEYPERLRNGLLHYFPWYFNTHGIGGYQTVTPRWLGDLIMHMPLSGIMTFINPRIAPGRDMSLHQLRDNQMEALFQWYPLWREINMGILYVVQVVILQTRFDLPLAILKALLQQYIYQVGLVVVARYNLFMDGMHNINIGDIGNVVDVNMDDHDHPHRPPSPPVPGGRPHIIQRAHVPQGRQHQAPPHTQAAPPVNPFAGYDLGTITHSSSAFIRHVMAWFDDVTDKALDDLVYLIDKYVSNGNFGFKKDLRKVIADKTLDTYHPFFWFKSTDDTSDDAPPKDDVPMNSAPIIITACTGFLCFGTSDLCVRGNHIGIGSLTLMILDFLLNVRQKLGLLGPYNPQNPEEPKFRLTTADDRLRYTQNFLFFTNRQTVLKTEYPLYYDYMVYSILRVAERTDDVLLRGSVPSPSLTATTLIGEGPFATRTYSSVPAQPPMEGSTNLNLHPDDLCNPPFYKQEIAGCAKATVSLLDSRVFHEQGGI